MHKSRRMRIANARTEVLDSAATVSERYWGKTIVMGMLERGGKVRAKVINDRKRPIVEQIVKDAVLKGSEVHTDGFTGYMGLSHAGDAHNVINHLEGDVKAYPHPRN